ncbi:hypothetical protein [Caudoviricetes sp.]|nr:hypothetical protein [Caudoviricetes sp.]
MNLPLGNMYMDDYELSVYDNGKKICKLNQRLVSQKQLTKAKIEVIKNWYLKAYKQTEYMKTATDPVLLKAAAAEWHNIQFALQKAWGFPEDKKYHRWWYLPQCTCPKLDNDDAYPTGYYTVSANCPVHGDKYA